MGLLMLRSRWTVVYVVDGSLRGQLPNSFVRRSFRPHVTRRPTTSRQRTILQYFAEADSKIPTRIAQSQGLDYMRAFGLLVVYSLQRGSYNDLHRYLGLYHALVA